MADETMACGYCGTIVSGNGERAGGFIHTTVSTECKCSKGETPKEIVPSSGYIKHVCEMDDLNRELTNAIITTAFLNQSFAGGEKPERAKEDTDVEDAYLEFFRAKQKQLISAMKRDSKTDA